MWPPTNYTAGAVWTNSAGTAMTGIVQDVRADQMAEALDERYIAAGLTALTNTYRPQSYVFHRSNVVGFKVAASNVLPYYAARWLADGTDFTGYCAASNLTAVPRMTHSNVVVYLGLPTNFWTVTPWIGADQSSNGMVGIKRVVDLMTWTVGTSIGTQQTHTAINWWESDGGEWEIEHLYWEDYYDERGASWAGATANVDASWDDPHVSEYVGDFPPESGLVRNGATNTTWPAESGGPERWSIGRFFDYGSYTGWQAQAAASSYRPQGVAATNFHRAADWYHAASGVVTWAAGGDGVSTTAVRLVQVPAGNSATVTASAAIGGEGFPKTQPDWCAEPDGTADSTGLGYATKRMEWVFRWDSDGNGFKYVEGP